MPFSAPPPKKIKTVGVTVAMDGWGEWTTFGATDAARRRTEKMELRRALAIVPGEVSVCYTSGNEDMIIMRERKRTRPASGRPMPWDEVRRPQEEEATRFGGAG